MIEWVDTPGEVATVLSIGAVLIAVLFWVIRAKVEQVLHETKPNSGTSMRDAVDRIEKSVDRLNEKLDDHISWHLDRTDS